MCRFLPTASLLMALAQPAAAEPRSAIPWLSDALQTAPDAGPAALPPSAGIEVLRLDDPPSDGVGLLSSRITGLPADLWGPTSLLRARRLILSVAGRGVPAAQELYRTLLLAATLPPKGRGPGAPLLRTRIDRLMQMGALEEAYELLVQSGLSTPDFLLRRFDIALLTGQEHRACDALLNRRDVQPTAAARIFCLARGDAWAEAVVALAVARESGEISPAEQALFARFLETQETPPDAAVEPPEILTPLAYVMLLAIGAGAEAAADTSLPVAFYHLDIGPNAPPRAQMLAAEHLVASGGLSYPLLFHAYRGGTPAASGGVWSRAEAVQELDAALASGDPHRVVRELPEADQLLGEIGLRVAFAREFAPYLAAMPAEAGFEPARMAALLLLGGQAAAARRWIDETAPLRYRVAMAVADPAYPVEEAREGTLEHAALRAFRPERPDVPVLQELLALLAEGRTGEALLRALALLDARTEIEPGDLTAALHLLAAAGQGDAARRIAVETLLMFEDG
ncbi:MAG TPA: hypothetical protein VFR34_02340 [Paracoccaceae bacterium]|nr:hypothetical protein [Paracoccaceae bacterium]